MNRPARRYNSGWLSVRCFPLKSLFVNFFADLNDVTVSSSLIQIVSYAVHRGLARRFVRVLSLHDRKAQLIGFFFEILLSLTIGCLLRSKLGEAFLVNKRKFALRCSFIQLDKVGARFPQ